MNVEVLRWPEEEQRRTTLSLARQPRLLIVESDTAAPLTSDPLEDWIRLPAPEADVSARVQALAEASKPTRVIPILDEDGLLRLGERWVVVPPLEGRLVQTLLDRFGTVVSREDLTRAGWGATSTRRNSLDVHMLRLRRRVIDLGLEIRTVRSRGYLLECPAL